MLITFLISGSDVISLESRPLNFGFSEMGLSSI